MFDQYFGMLIPVMWLVISYFLAITSGWNKLANKYKEGSTQRGKKWWFKSALMAKNASYSSVIFFTANHEGLGLSIFLPFRLGHPPVFIPWHDIDVSEEKRYFRSMVKFDVRDMGIPVYVNKSLGKKIRQAGGV